MSATLIYCSEQAHTESNRFTNNVVGSIIVFLASDAEVNGEQLMV
jgi:hypothetical protein